MTGGRREEQLGMFGELDGLFAPALIPTTPAGEVKLNPGRYFFADEPAGGLLDLVAHEPVDVADIDPDAWPAEASQDRPCETFRPGDNAGLFCGRCGWEQRDHDDAPGWMRPEVDEDDDEPDEIQAQHIPTSTGGPWVLIPCSGEKLDRRAPVAELYTGQLFRAALKAARRLTSDDRIRVLSGRWGLVPLSLVLDPYEQKIGTEGAVHHTVLRGQLDRMAHYGRTVIGLLPSNYDAAISAPDAPYTACTESVGVEYTNPLRGSRGIGDQRHRLADIARTGQYVEAVADDEHPGHLVPVVVELAPRCTSCPWDQLPAQDPCPGRYGAACTDTAPRSVKP